MEKIGKNTALKVLFGASSLYLFAAMLLGPLYAVFVESIGGSVLTVSLSTAVFFVSSTVFLYFVSKAGDKIKNKEMVLGISWFIRGFAFLSLIWTTSIPHLLLVQAVLGLGEALGTPNFNYLFAKHLDKNAEVLEYSDWSIVSNVIMAISVVVGGLVVSAFGFKVLFFTIFVFCISAGSWLLLTPRKVW